MVFFKNFLEPLCYLIYSFLLFNVIKKEGVFHKRILFAYYIIATLLTFFASYIEIIKGNNNKIYSAFFLITVFVLSYYFHSILNSVSKRSFIYLLLFINVVLFSKYTVLNASLSYNPYVTAFCFFSIAIYSLLYFDHLLRNVSESDVLGQIDFWLIAGYLIYFLSCFFIILFYGDASREDRAVLWAIQNIILFLSCITSSFGFFRIKYLKRFQ